MSGPCGAELGQGIDGGFGFTGADDRAMTLVGGVVGLERLADGSPGRPITVEDEIVLDGELEAGPGELALHPEHRWIPPTVGALVQICVTPGCPAGFVKTLHGVVQVHRPSPRRMK